MFVLHKLLSETNSAEEQVVQNGVGAGSLGTTLRASQSSLDDQRIASSGLTLEGSENEFVLVLKNSQSANQADW
jgi:hypothetical protein